MKVLKFYARKSFLNKRTKKSRISGLNKSKIIEISKTIAKYSFYVNSGSVISVILRFEDFKNYLPLMSIFYFGLILFFVFHLHILIRLHKNKNYSNYSIIIIPLFSLASFIGCSLYLFSVLFMSI